jgi:hypothetical protein
VIDPDQTLAVYQSMTQAIENKCLEDETVQDRFLDAYFKWITAGSLNRFKNLDKFSVKAYSNGTTEGFDKFYLKYAHRRFRCLRGEYMYHSASWKLICPTWQYIEDEPLDKNDAVVISMPFSDTGNQHSLLNDLLDTCDILEIPVLIDCAFVGICQHIDFDFDRSCVTDITFSLSKTFPVSNLRIGMRLTRIDNDDGLLIHNKTNYNNRLGAAVGLDLINQFSVDWNVTHYYSQQTNLCEKLHIVPSNTVIFGIGDGRYQQYNRGGTTNRLSLAKWLSSGELPND